MENRMNKGCCGIFVLVVCISCRTSQLPNAALVCSNAAALEQTVDLESPDVETDDALRFERSILSLGEVRLGTTRHVSLRATNTSEQPLVLMEVTTACGCTKVEWQKKPIPPHDSAELRIAFTAEQEGAFFKKIAVRHSAAKHPVSFLIEGVVVPESSEHEVEKR